MAQQLEEQILEALNRLSPLGKRNILRKLIGDIEELDRMIDRNQEKLRAICKERGVDFSTLTENEREELIERILHED